MGIKQHKPEEIVTKFRQVEVLCGQGMARVDAIRQMQKTEQAFYRWRKQCGGTGTDQLRELKRLQKENDARSQELAGAVEAAGEADAAREREEGLVCADGAAAPPCASAGH